MPFQPGGYPADEVNAALIAKAPKLAEQASLGMGIMTERLSKEQLEKIEALVKWALAYSLTLNTDDTKKLAQVVFDLQKEIVGLRVMLDGGHGSVEVSK